MSNPSGEDPDGLPPPGSRWGAGAQSVLPYLTKSLQARPFAAPEAREPRRRDGHHPVFGQWPPAPGSAKR